MSKPTVTVVGSTNLDITATVHRLPGPGETLLGRTLVHSPGGKGGNQALAASRAGANVRFITAVGSEGEGLFAALNVALVNVVQQLQDGHLLRGVIHLDGLEMAFLGRSGLTPDLKCQFHYL